MKKLFLSSFVVLYSLFSFSQGFEWSDDLEENMRSSFSEVESSTRSYYPSSYSLERYTPEYISHQGETSMCVAYALANCRTIIYAKNKRLVDREIIFANSFSPFHLYYRTKSDKDNVCSFGLSPIDALEELMEGGIAQLIDVEYPDYWPFTDKILCTYYPPSYSSDISDAYKYKIDEPRYFKDGLSISQKISALKGEISNGSPIFFGMQPFPKSLWLSYGKDFWKPEYNEEKSGDMGHAMVIIAYDDKKYGGAFQILNSYGAKWGNDGKIWIRYNDLMDYGMAFFSISRKYETDVFGSIPSAKKISSDIDSTLELSQPSFIQVNENDKI